MDIRSEELSAASRNNDFRVIGAHPMALSLVACCCVVAAYRPPVTPNVQAAARCAGARLSARAAPLHSAPSFDGEQAVPDPETTAAGDLAAPPGRYYAPRVVCTAIARLGGGIELVGKTVERASLLVTNAAGNITGTLAWLLALIACSPLFLVVRVRARAMARVRARVGGRVRVSPHPIPNPNPNQASSMAYAGRGARVLAERSYATASGGARLPLAARVLAAPKSSAKSSALRERMQADSEP